jgi:hypothetical protein
MNDTTNCISAIIPSHQSLTTTFSTPAMAALLLLAAGCAGEFGAVRNLSEAKVALPPLAPRVAQVALPSSIVGAVGSDTDALLGYSVALGDFNADGFMDVAAGLPGAENGWISATLTCQPALA